MAKSLKYQMINAECMFLEIKKQERAIRSLLTKKEKMIKELNDLIKSLCEDEGYIDEHGYYHLSHAMYERMRRGEPIPPISPKR